MAPRGEAELVLLRKLAEQLAGQRKEKTTTGHLLAAVASHPGPASDLLKDRRLEVDVLLRAARVLQDDAPDAISRAIQRARELAARSPQREALAIHLLFALCQDKASAAMRTLAQCGMDVTRLRTAALQLAMGLAPAPRPAPPAAASVAAFDLARRAESGKAPSVPPPSAQAPAPVARVPATIPSAAPPRVKIPVVPSLAPVDPTRAPSIAPPPVAKKKKAEPKARARHVSPNAARFALDKKSFPMLVAVGKNLTLAAAMGELDPVVGRDEEIDRTLDVLAKRQGNCPCLVGAAGVGKTSVARGIALRIASGEDVVSLDDRILVEIEPVTLLSGTGARGALAEKLAQLRAEVKSAEGRIVVFFDEIHTLFGPDAGDEAASELKIALAKGELPCVGATTFEEYKRFVESDPALARRFTAIEVVEPSPEEAFLALEGILPAFAQHHHTEYTREAIAAAVQWSSRYVTSRALPEKAVGILDLAGARARRRSIESVGPEQIAEVVSEMAHVPMERLLESDGERMLRLESMLGERVIGHRDALARIAAVLRRNAGGFRSRRPIGSFLLLGPTGVGKTETAKAIAECLFHSADAMTRLDMSEYAEAHAIARLVGAPPGYVGHEAGGQLTESVRRRPYQVVLLDEIEKAHLDVLEGFLQVFDEGRLTDGRGRTVDFTNTVILLTSNLGADVKPREVARGRIGFAATKQEVTAYADAVTLAARRALPPELYNRIDEVLAFGPLEKSDVREIATKMIAQLKTELERARGVFLDVSAGAVEVLLETGGFDPELGARPMRRAVARLIEAPIAEMILRGEIARRDVVTLDVEDGKIVVDSVTPSRTPAPMGETG
jgi:ATP-dependent Clp protease ATP-binding subunit ClpC